MDGEIEAKLAALLQTVPKQQGAATMLNPTSDRDSFHLGDLLAYGSLNRSLQLTTAFHALIKSRQSLAAAPMVRLQLDNALRFSAIHLIDVDELEQFVVSLVNGIAMDKLKDRHGKRLKDVYLCEQLARNWPWVKTIYSEGSGYVHLSEKHVFSAIQELIEADGSPGDLNIHIGQRDAYVPAMFYLNLIDAFQAATNLFLEQIKQWVVLKASIMKKTDLTNQLPQPYEEEACGE